MIFKRQAEEFLRHEEIGTYLVRKSDSRDGYSLSFKAENRCRHYMIDALPNGKYIIIGEPRVHNTLKDLIEYHRKVSLTNDLVLFFHFKIIKIKIKLNIFLSIFKHKLSNWNGYLSFAFNLESK